MKKSYSLIVTLVSLAFIGTMISGCGDTSEEYLTPNLPNQITTEQAEFIPEDEKRPGDPWIELYAPSSPLYVGNQFETRIGNHGWTIENVSWSATGARMVSSVGNYSAKWEVQSATTRGVVYATITCRFNNIRQTITVPSHSSNFLPAPKITGNPPSDLSQYAQFYIMGLAPNHTYTWSGDAYQYCVSQGAGYITLKFPRYTVYQLSCTIRSEKGTELFTVDRLVDVWYQAPPGGGGDYISGEVDPDDRIPDDNKRNPLL